MMIQQSVKNRSTADPARPAVPNASISTRNTKCVGRLFTPAAVAIATDSRPSSLALTLALGVSPGYETANEFIVLFSSVLRSCLLALHCNHLLYIILSLMFLYISSASLSFLQSSSISFYLLCYIYICNVRVCLYSSSQLNCPKDFVKRLYFIINDYLYNY